MFEDEMQECHLAATAEDYYRVTEAERHEEKLARAQAYIRALEAQVAWMRHQSHNATLAMMANG